MTITRREFGRTSLLAVGAVATVGSVEFIGGCNPAVFNAILTYVQLGLSAFSAIVTIIPGIGTTVGVGVALVNASFADIRAAVNSYNAAPAASKASLLGKIETAISSTIQNLTAFWTDAKLPSGTLATTVEQLLGIIVSTLESFQAQLPIPVSARKAAKAPVMLNKKVVAPVKRSAASFKADFNSVLISNGYSSHTI